MAEPTSQNAWLTREPSKAIKLLLERDTKPDLARLRDGFTPLHIVANNGNDSAVHEILRVEFVNATDDIARQKSRTAAGH
ncbi:hypothetical protein SLS62_000426 [Diatrype stigma]|uniref:Uncharacterized protein n=1 Tax=Diatrype stigma TaxID=117547 RepID=A0AAN9YWV5_9PEZI